MGVEPRSVPVEKLVRPRGPRIVDISPPVSPKSEVFPGDTPFSSRRVMELAAGHSCNVTTVQTTVHVGAHVDAPLHFHPEGKDAASVDLDACVGPARVVRMPRRAGITREDVEALDLEGVERLLLATRKPAAPARFRDGFAWLEPGAARFLAGTGLRLFGLDTFSVDHPESKTLESHHALMAGGVTILEGLDLSAATPGDHELIALPLRLVGCDASPVRAVLREEAVPGRRGGLPRGARARASSPAPAGGRLSANPTPGDDVEPNCVYSRMRLLNGDRVRVTLDRSANVMLLDDANFERYVAGKEFTYFGGEAAQSPVMLAPPREGAWNVVVDSEDDDVKVQIEIVGNA